MSLFLFISEGVLASLSVRAFLVFGWLSCLEGRGCGSGLPKSLCRLYLHGCLFERSDVIDKYKDAMAWEMKDNKPRVTVSERAGQGLARGTKMLL